MYFALRSCRGHVECSIELADRGGYGRPPTPYPTASTSAGQAVRLRRNINFGQPGQSRRELVPWLGLLQGQSAILITLI
jgi:hypothetical protein